MLARPTRLNVFTLWHLLSLDAPTVAVLWLCFAARASHTPLPAVLPLAMFLAVWLLYATDRLLDAHPLTTLAWVPQVPAQSHRADPRVTRSLRPRHRFHRRHRLPFALAILITAATLAILVTTLPVAFLRFYLVLAALVAVWFALIHLTRLPLPKEFAPGLFFAAAVFLPIPHAALPATLFAALCTLNCLYIYRWEHPAPSANPHPTTRLALRHLPKLTFILAFIPLASPRPIPIAITLSGLALLTLDHRRDNLPPTTLRAAADLALLTPVLVLPFLT